MNNTKNYKSKGKWLERTQRKPSVAGGSRLCRRAQRRLRCKWKLWMWRKEKEKYLFRIFSRKEKKRVTRSDPSLDPKTQNRKLRKQTNPVNVKAEKAARKRLQLERSSKRTTETNLARIPQRPTHSLVPVETIKRQTVAYPLEQHTIDTTGRQDKASEVKVSLQALTEEIHEFIDNFYRKYGSFIPFQKRDVFQHLKTKFNKDLNDRANPIVLEVNTYKDAVARKPSGSFRVVYQKHTLSLDDLSTLADQNWLNDQIINMYGELIMESAHHKVHFLNSFFHPQLMTKGYDGVKRWTKQVDLFSKTLLLVPVHLDVHWCLVTANVVTKKIYLYDSQGNAIKHIARNIQEYLMKEAREKQKSAFMNGWTLWLSEGIPQQMNENDCGLFVLEYCRRLALEKPMRFSQKDIPKIRRRIYKELCDCKLHEEQ